MGYFSAGFLCVCVLSMTVVEVLDEELEINKKLTEKFPKNSVQFVYLNSRAISDRFTISIIEKLKWK